MRILIDTNVLVSAALFPQGLARRALVEAVEGPDDAMVCDYSLAELNDVFIRKFPDDVFLLPQFMTYLEQGVKTVSTPEASLELEVRLRDPNDQPILRAAMASHTDIILTGDKDFLDAGLTHPEAMSPHDYLKHQIGT